MKKLISSSILATVLIFGLAISAFAEGEANSDLVIDLSGSDTSSEVDTGSTVDTGTEVDNGSLIDNQSGEDVTAGNGAELPIDQGNVGTTDLDTGSVDLSTGTGTVDSKPKVEDKASETQVGVEQPLSKTGIEDNWFIGAVILLAGALGALFWFRKKETAM